MIYSGPHHVTGKSRTIVTCDTPGCTSSMYMPGDAGVHYAGTMLRTIDWHIPETPRSVVPLTFAATCPTHVGGA